jgi:hypothetical protein
MCNVRLSLCVLGCLALTFASCAGCGTTAGGPPADSLFWKAQGDGPSNTEPLMVLTSGTRTDWYSLENAVTQDGKTYLRSNGVFFREGPEGIFLEESLSAGPDVYPVLVMPRTVRVGMTWGTRSRKDGPVTLHQVTSRAVAITPVGSKTVWDLRTSDEADTVRSREVAEFIEGVGYLGTSLTVVRSQPPGHLETDVTPTPLTPAIGTDGRQATVANFRPRELQIIDPGFGAPRTVFIDGERITWDAIAGKEVASRAAHCLTWNGHLLTDVPGDLPNGVHFHRGNKCPGDAEVGGTRYWTTRDTVSVLTEGVVWLPESQVNSPLVSGPLWTTFVGSDGRPRILTANGSPSGTQLTVQSFAAPPGVDTFTKQMLAGWVMAGGRPPYMVPGAGSSADSPSFAVLDEYAGVSHAALDGNLLRVPTVAGAAQGVRSLGVDGSGQRLWASTADGAIDRLVVDASGVRRERLARVAVPAGQTLVGAVVDGSKLLVFTHEDTKVAPGVLGYDDGTVFAWTAPPLSAPVPEPFTPALGVQSSWVASDFRVCWPPTPEAFDATGWTVGGAPPAAVIPDPARACVTLVRDTDAMVDGVVEGGQSPPPADWNRAEGPVPGIGTMLFANQRNATAQAVDSKLDYRKIVPLPSGGGVTDDEVFAPGVIPVMRTLGQNLVGSGTVGDRSGAGLWRPGYRQHPVEQADDQFVELFSGPLPKLIALQTIGRSHVSSMPVVLGPAETGGIIVMTYANFPTTPTRVWFVKPDATLEELPVDKDQFSVDFRRANGEYCRGVDVPHFCMQGDGSGRRDTTRRFYSIPVNSDLGSTGWAPLGDGTYLVHDPDAVGGMHVGRLDADTWTITPYPSSSDPATRVNFLRQGPDGRLWAVLSYSDGRVVAGRAEASGLVPMAAQPWAAVVGEVAFAPAEPWAIFPFHEMVLVFHYDAAKRLVCVRYFPTQ